MDGVKRFRFWFIAAWVAVLVAGSLMPTWLKIVLHTHSERHFFSHIVNVHRLLHVAAFGSTTLLLLAFAPRRSGLFVVAGLIGLSFLLEWAQNHIYQNGMEWHDFRDDVIVIVSGALISQRLRREVSPDGSGTIPDYQPRARLAQD